MGVFVHLYSTWSIVVVLYLFSLFYVIVHADNVMAYSPA